MSKEFYISRNSTKVHAAKDYFEVIKKHHEFRMRMKSNVLKWFAYCTDCRNKIFLEERDSPNNFFFKHHKGYVEDELALSMCTNYFPERGKADQGVPIPAEVNNAIAHFAVENALCLYQYISDLIGREFYMSERYFAGYLGEIFLKGKQYSTSDMLTISKLPFIFLCLLDEPPGVIKKNDYAIQGSNFLKLASLEPEHRDNIFKKSHDVSFIPSTDYKTISMKVFKRGSVGGEPHSECLFEKKYEITFDFEKKVSDFNSYTMPLINDLSLCKSDKQRIFIKNLASKHLSIQEVLHTFPAFHQSIE